MDIKQSLCFLSIIILVIKCRNEDEDKSKVDFKCLRNKNQYPYMAYYENEALPTVGRRYCFACLTDTMYKHYKVYGVQYKTRTYKFDKQYEKQCEKTGFKYLQFLHIYDVIQYLLNEIFHEPSLSATAADLAGLYQATLKCEGDQLSFTTMYGKAALVYDSKTKKTELRPVNNDQEGLQHVYLNDRNDLVRETCTREGVKRRENYLVFEMHYVHVSETEGKRCFDYNNEDQSHLKEVHPIIGIGFKPYKKDVGSHADACLDIMNELANVKGLKSRLSDDQANLNGEMTGYKNNQELYRYNLYLKLEIGAEASTPAAAEVLKDRTEEFEVSINSVGNFGIQTALVCQNANISDKNKPLQILVVMRFDFYSDSCVFGVDLKNQDSLEFLYSFEEAVLATKLVRESNYLIGRVVALALVPDIGAILIISIYIVYRKKFPKARIEESFV